MTIGNPVTATLASLGPAATAGLCLTLEPAMDCLGAKDIDATVSGEFFQAGCIDPAIVTTAEAHCPVECNPPGAGVPAHARRLDAAVPLPRLRPRLRARTDQVIRATTWT